jgi:hypothetical protein
VERESVRLNRITAFQTAELEYERGRWNSQCRSEIRRYWEEHRWRRQSTGSLLTLRHESVGSKRD